jgi:DNA-binding protein HU-beta
MYKTELIKAMVKKTEEQNVPLTAKQMESALSALIQTLTDALKSGEKVVLPGFGMFGVRMRPARRGYNPLTGEQIALPEKKLPAFKAGNTLKDAVAAE